MNNTYTLTMLLSILSFTLATVMTPGPNNIMLLSSGLTYGYKKSIPHILGVIIGFSVMVAAVGLGIGIVFDIFPIMFKILKIIGIAYLLWMAYKIANSSDSFEAKVNNTKKPFTFIQAALFQWVNPKAWVMAITAISLFTIANDDILFQVFVLAGIYLLSGILSANIWTLGGVFLNKFIKNKKSIKVFNISMAFLIVFSVIPFVF